jgi:hypothetical protein
MATLLIDDSGGVWPAEPETVARRFGLRRGGDPVARAVALGFVFVGFYAAGARIALRPEFVTRRAISRLAVVIAGQDPFRVALSLDGKMSSWELIAGACSAIARIEAVVADARSPEPRPLLYSTPLPLDWLGNIAQGRLLPALRTWDATQRRWEPDFQGRLQDIGFLQRTIIVRKPRRSERLVIEHWGNGRGLYGRDWPRISRGRDFEEQPNISVGVWRAAMVRQKIAAGQASLDLDEAVLRTPDGRLVRFRVYRLALPWSTASGEQLVSEIDAGRRVVVLDRPNPAN